MQLASLALFLIVLHVCGRAESRARLRRPQAGGAEAAAPAGPGRLRLDLRTNAPHLVVLPGAAAPGSWVLIFDLRQRRFLCVDIKGQLFKSRQKDRGHCLFQHIWFRPGERHDLFSSVSRSWLVKLGVGRPGAVRGGPPDGQLVKRQRRSEEVNPSDPLRTESHPSPPVKDVEPNQAGAVSKETITSCDDPLRVLRPNGHGSPVKTNIAERAEQE
ncbi:fibroblast growth factor 23-like [Poeciliopsis prolifica]|uniref:fibroblast growth factor 23-like n=1 Tax=Poeciliopsis prolifica TaxID=188132 RepID=UPI00241421E9|nr:fibroblast growth factor 23-like [Poeciliopsis prolifica]XP_054881811.1 fibroblast growth factor 23-like [Poeciliopsis prolifica]